MLSILNIRTPLGIEGQWTADPLKWDNAYFEYLVEDEYELWTGLGAASDLDSETMIIFIKP